VVSPMLRHPGESAKLPPPNRVVVVLTFRLRAAEHLKGLSLSMTRSPAIDISDSVVTS
jgi:hypothetical protein